MMEQGVSNLQRSFHSSCSWEKYIIHSSLTIKWSSAFSFLLVLCRTGELLFFSFFFLLLVENTVGRRAERSHSPCRAWGPERHPEPPSPHLGLGNRDKHLAWTQNFCKSWWVQKTGQRMTLPPQTILKSGNFDDAPQVGSSKTPAGTQTWCLCRFTSSTVIRVKSPFILCWSLRYCIL